jgi:hypothetical protein
MVQVKRWDRVEEEGWLGGLGWADPTPTHHWLVLVSLLARLKPCRCDKTPRQSFSTSCEAVPL